MSEKILRASEVRAVLGGISNSTLYQWVKDGKLPPPMKIVPGGRASGWLESTIDKIIQQRIAQSS